jgi:DNA-binding response OmpR family regulator
MLIARLGFEVRTAHDGRGAIAAAEALRPDVVLLDIGLPDLSGYDVARTLRERMPGAPMRIVALTGWGQPEARERALEAGFDFHLVKPADLRKLREVLGAE